MRTSERFRSDLFSVRDRSTIPQRRSLVVVSTESANAISSQRPNGVISASTPHLPVEISRHAFASRSCPLQLSSRPRIARSRAGFSQPGEQESPTRVKSRARYLGGVQLTSPLREITRPGNLECNKAIVSLAWRGRWHAVPLKPRIVTTPHHPIQATRIAPRSRRHGVRHAFAEHFPIFPFSRGKARSPRSKRNSPLWDFGTCAFLSILLVRSR